MALTELFENRAQEVVPIKAERIFDSCSDKDCLADLQVQLDIGVLPEQYSLVKVKNVWVESVMISLEPLNFNRGFYSVDITYTFRLELCVFEKPNSSGVKVFGTAYHSKNVVLFGSEVNTNIFTSEEDITYNNCDSCTEDIKLPTATVQVAKPVVLDARIAPAFCPPHHHHRHRPLNECGCEDGCPKPELPNPFSKVVLVTLGIFSVIELSRMVTVLAATYEYTIPEKECRNFSNENPCKAFDKMKFPAEEFSPVSVRDNDFNCGCGSR